MRIQNPAKHLRWSLLQKLLMAKSRIDKKRKEEREKTKERNFIILSLTLTWLVLIQLKTVDASWIMASILQLYWNQKKLFFFWNHIVPNHFGISLFQIVFWIYPISIKVFLFTDLVLVSVNYTSVSRCRFRPGQIERPRTIGHARVRKTYHEYKRLVLDAWVVTGRASADWFVTVFIIQTNTGKYYTQLKMKSFYLTISTWSLNHKPTIQTTIKSSCLVPFSRIFIPKIFCKLLSKYLWQTLFLGKSLLWGCSSEHL